MTVPMSTFQVRVNLCQGVARLARALDDAAYARFKAATEFAKLMLARTLDRLEGLPAYLISHAGFDLTVKFDRVREVFVVVGAEDLGDDPEPPEGGGGRALIALARPLGFDVGEAALPLVSEEPSRRPEGWLSALPFALPTHEVWLDTADLQTALEAASWSEWHAASASAISAAQACDGFAMPARSRQLRGVFVFRCLGDEELAVLVSPEPSDP